MKEEWKCTITAHGEQFVMMAGPLTMLVLSADNLVFFIPYLIGWIILSWERARFGWTMLVALVMSRRYFRADIVEWEFTTVITVTTSAFDVETLKVRITDERSVSNYFSNNLHDRLIIRLTIYRYHLFR